MGPELSMVMCKTMKETRNVETALAIAGWKCGAAMRVFGGDSIEALARRARNAGRRAARKERN